jgi:cell division septation protein DedD
MMGYGRQKGKARRIASHLGAIAIGLCLTASQVNSTHAQEAGASEALRTSDTDPTGTYPAAPTAAAISEWLRNNTNISPAAAIAVGSDMVVSIARFGTFDPTSGTVKDVTLRGEAISPKFSDLIRGRSTMVSMDVDCDKLMILIHQTDVYPQTNLVGTARVLPGSKQWIKPVGTAYLADTVTAVCKAKGPGAMQAAAPSPPPRPQPPAPVANRTEATGIEVQIVATGSAEAAEAALNSVRSALPDQTRPHGSRIQAIEVGGKTVYRALFTGFANREMAMALCNTLRASGRACLVR